MSNGTRNGIQSEPLPAFLTKEVGISESYLRKWCLELEKHEYTFIKVRDPKSNCRKT
uniref:hypothetical protein n=1 Tax=Bacillus mycoides TaxID=1405 RepID=UPI0012F79F4E|nr:hypothetical protein [Bacillus mycoides]